MDSNPWTQGNLIFELTESARVEDLEGANTFIQKLRDRGYPVCLDDFGAGAASFQYLSAIDVDVVKIDGPVVKSAEAIERGRAFLTALASFCRELKVETIAEMVDTPETTKFCYDCGIDFVQGFLFGPPNFDLNVFSDVKSKLSNVPGGSADGGGHGSHGKHAQDAGIKTANAVPVVISTVEPEASAIETTDEAAAPQPVAETATEEPSSVSDPEPEAEAPNAPDTLDDLLNEAALAAQPETDVGTPASADAASDDGDDDTPKNNQDDPKPATV